MEHSSDFKDTILPLFEETRAEWIERARETAITIWQAKGEVTADDVREICPPPEGLSPNVMGAVFHPRKAWELIRYQKSSRAVTHGRVMGVWKYRGPIDG